MNIADRESEESLYDEFRRKHPTSLKDRMMQKIETLKKTDSANRRIATLGYALSCYKYILN